MKQIKLLMLLVCAATFGSVQGQVPPPPVTIEYVATYTWTPTISNLWTDAENWVVVYHEPPLNTNVLPTPPDVPIVVATYPNVTTTNGLTQIHNVVIPSNSQAFPVVSSPITTLVVSNLTIAQGASINLAGRSLKINGFISGTGVITGGLSGGVLPNVTVDALNSVGVYTNTESHNPTFNVGANPALPLIYFNNFNAGPFESLDGCLSCPPTSVGFTFPIQNGYTFNAKGVGGTANGGVYLFDKSPIVGVTNDSVSRQLSTFVENDELVITFSGLPVYSVSGNFSVTDLDFTPMTLGKPIDFQNIPAPNTIFEPTVTNNVDVVVTLANGAEHAYTGSASGQFFGFVSDIPITSITIASGVFIDNIQTVGFPTLDNIKIGTKNETGTLYFDQTSAETRKIGQLIINTADAATSVGTVTLGSRVDVQSLVDPASGILNATPTSSPLASNLALLSNATNTASVAPHTVSGKISGNVTVERYIAPSRKKQWRFFGLPYAVPTALSKLSGMTFQVGATPSMMIFKEPFADGSLGSGGNRNAGYENLTSLNDVIDAGQGFAAWVYDLDNGSNHFTDNLAQAQTLTSSGPLNEDGNPFAAPITNLGLVGLRGWNLISNPFASTIDLRSQGVPAVPGVYNILFNSSDPTIYRWNPQTEAWGSYNRVTPVVGSGADRFIESGSSFFVRMNTGSFSTVVFPQSAKVQNTSSNLNQFGKNGIPTLDGAMVKVNSTDKEIDHTGIRLRAFGPGNPLPIESFLGLTFSDATNGFDNKYDAFHLGRTSGAAVSIKSKDANLSVQFDQPISEAGKEKRYYPLIVTVPVSGKAKIEMDIEGDWNSLNSVSLIDKKEGKTIPLTGKRLNYEFNMVNTKEEDRFMLAINHVNVAEKSGITSTDVRVMNNPVRADVIDAIIAHPTAKAKSYSVVNASGATVNKGSIEDNNSVQHRLGFGKSNTNGVMYLRVDFENGDSKTVKFIKL